MARTPKLDTYAKQQAYKAWQEEQKQYQTPFRKGEIDRAAKEAGVDTEEGAGDDPTSEEDMSENQKANSNIYEPGSIGDQNYRANRSTLAASAGAAYSGPGNQNEYPGANPSQLAALSKMPGERSLQEQNDLKIRARAEEIALKRGQKIKDGGISQDLIAEQVGGSVGRREAKAAVAYQEASAATLANSGRGPNGEKKARMPSFSNQTVIPGGQDERPAPGSPGITPIGYAMRKMADGTFRGASPDGNGGTALRDFSTQAEAMAYYRPQPQPAQQSPALDNGPGQRAAAGQPMFPAPGAPTGAIPGPFEAAYNAGMPKPAPTTMQTAEAARTTSPTTQLQMNSPAPGAVPAVAQSPVPAPAAAATNPFGTFASPNPQFINKSPDKSVSLTESGIDYLRKRAADTNREMGTPKRTGYQAIASELNPFGK